MATLRDAASLVAAKTKGALPASLAYTLARFLAAKYLADDRGLPANLSPEPGTDAVWHALLLRPVLYQEFCRAVWDATGYGAAFPGVVDHDPSTESDPEPVKQKRRVAAASAETRVDKRACALPSAFTVVVKTLQTGETTTVYLTKESTGIFLKKEVAKLTEVPYNTQCLWISCRTILDDDVLSQIGVQDGSVVHLTLRLGGC